MPHHPTQHIIIEPLADVTLHAAARILAAAHRAVAERGSFTMVLAGGQSPRPLYTMLGQGLPRTELHRWQLPLPKEYADTELICHHQHGSFKAMNVVCHQTLPIPISA